MFLKRLIDLLITDKRSNPSNYALVVLSEGAEWQGYKLQEYGEADAFGHRKKANVGEDLSEEVGKATGEETIVSDLTYDLRSGSPDFVDKMVASTFAGMATDCIAKGEHGRMMAISEGCYAAVPAGMVRPSAPHVRVEPARLTQSKRAHSTDHRRAEGRCTATAAQVLGG